MNYFIRTLSSMTYGLFASLIIGSILNIIGLKLDIPFLHETVWPAAKALTGPAIAAAIAYGLKAPTLVVLSTLIPGAIGGSIGGPVGAYLAAIAGTELGRLVSQKTKVDILVTPTVTIVAGSLVGYFVGPYIQEMMTAFGQLVESATMLQPFWMSIVVAVLMGMALTLPISSAAIGIMLSLGGLAAGAATVGCSAQMFGFAVMGLTVNGLGGFLSQSLGTSMLQMPNIMKNWRIWIPPTLAGAITAPIATMVFHLENTPIGSGMGTSGFVGQFGTLEAMEAADHSVAYILVAIGTCHIILPTLLTGIFTLLLIKLKWIKPTDVKL